MTKPKLDRDTGFSLTEEFSSLLQSLLQQVDEAKERYFQGEGAKALDEVVATWEQILTLPGLSVTSLDQQAALLNEAATVFVYRYSSDGRLEDLNTALTLIQQALDLTPPGGPSRAALLNSLGNRLSDRYVQKG